MSTENEIYEKRKLKKKYLEFRIRENLKILAKCQDLVFGCLEVMWTAKECYKTSKEVTLGDKMKLKILLSISGWSFFGVWCKGHAANKKR